MHARRPAPARLDATRTLPTDVEQPPHRRGDLQWQYGRLPEPLSIERHCFGNDCSWHAPTNGHSSLACHHHADADILLQCEHGPGADGRNAARFNNSATQPLVSTSPLPPAQSGPATEQPCPLDPQGTECLGTER